MNKHPQEYTILVVDDDVDFLTQQQAILAAAGFRVVTAASLDEAEHFLAASRPDLAIVDLMMEHMDGGFALCHHIKKRDPSIPVILATAVASKTDLEFDAATPEERSWIKADVVLSKPLRSEQLLQEMERLLKDA